MTNERLKNALSKFNQINSTNGLEKITVEQALVLRGGATTNSCTCKKGTLTVSGGTVITKQ